MFGPPLIALLATAGAQTMIACDSSNAPSPYSTASCSIQGAAPCTLGGSKLSCDMNAVSCDTNVGASMWAVNYGSSSGVTAFGHCNVAGQVTNYCCRVNDRDGKLDTVQLAGTSRPDEGIAFTFLQAGGAVYDLAPTTATAKLTARAYGRQGRDYIDGSHSTNKNYTETLYGNVGNDEIHGHDGDDRIEGGLGNDDLYGGPGKDLLLGQNGNDYLYGEEQDDQLHGGDGDDRLYGGNGEDDLYGALGNDSLYGDNDDDVLCDSSTLPGQQQCPTWYMEGGGGLYDKAYIPANPFCGVYNTRPLGNRTVEFARHGSLDFTSDVLGNDGVEEFDNTPYPECSALYAIGGY